MANARSIPLVRRRCWSAIMNVTAQNTPRKFGSENAAAGRIVPPLAVALRLMSRPPREPMRLSNGSG